MLKALIADVRKCSGCEACVLACSFEKTGQFSPRGRIAVQREIQDGVNFPLAAINYVGENNTVVERCDLCGGNPACVRACSIDVLIYGNWDEMAETDSAASAGKPLVSLIALKEM